MSGSQLACREDAQSIFRKYWEYAHPIREFMAGTSEEAIQVPITSEHLDLWYKIEFPEGQMG